MPNEAVLAHLRAQRGLVTRSQALDEGLSPRVIDHRIATGEWERVHPTVYRLAGMPTSWHQACLAATLWLSRAGLAAISHLSGIRLWGLDAGMSLEAIEVSVDHTSRCRSGALTVHRRSNLTPNAIVRRAGIPVTSVEHTLLDAASLLVETRLERCVEDAIRLRLTNHAALSMLLDRHAGTGRAGSAAMRRIIEARAPGGDAAANGELELAAWRLLRASGLPLPVRQKVLVVDGVDWTVDFFWPGTKVGLETDGYSTHAGRQAFEKDRRKLRELASAGYRILPATWWDVTRGHEALLDTIERALRREIPWATTHMACG